MQSNSFKGWDIAKVEHLRLSDSGKEMVVISVNDIVWNRSNGETVMSGLRRSWPRTQFVRCPAYDRTDALCFSGGPKDTFMVMLGQEL